MGNVLPVAAKSVIGAAVADFFLQIKDYFFGFTQKPSAIVSLEVARAEEELRLKREIAELQATIRRVKELRDAKEEIQHGVVSNGSDGRQANNSVASMPSTHPENTLQQSSNVSTQDELQQLESKVRHSQAAIAALAMLQTRATAMGLNSEFYNIAVAGVCGAGKSSLVNALRGKVASNEGNAADYAAVGIVETTEMATAYCWDEYPYLRVWDMPGACSRLHDAAAYVNNQAIAMFDLVLLVVGKRFFKIDYDIVMEAMRMHIPLLVVRNKCDESIGDMIKEAHGALSVETAKQRLRTDTTAYINNQFIMAGNNGLRPEIFFISTFVITDHAQYGVHAMDELSLCRRIREIALPRFPQTSSA